MFLEEARVKMTVTKKKVLTVTYLQVQISIT